MSKAGSIARKLRGGPSAPKRAPEKLDGMSSAELDDAIRERIGYVERARRQKAASVPVAEREQALKRLAATIDDLARLREERRSRSAAVTSSAADSGVRAVSTDSLYSDGRRFVGPTLMDRSTSEARFWQQEQEREERAREKRTREAEERRERLRAANAEREEARRRRDVDAGLAPAVSGAWSSAWDSHAADTLAAVFSDPSLLLMWLGRDVEALDRDPPLHAGDLVVLYTALATLAARGTAEVVFPLSSSRRWMPVNFASSQASPTSPAASLQHLARNGWLVVRRAGDRVHVSRGPVAEQARLAFVDRDRKPGGRS